MLSITELHFELDEIKNRKARADHLRSNRKAGQCNYTVAESFPPINKHLSSLKTTKILCALINVQHCMVMQSEGLFKIFLIFVLIAFRIVARSFYKFVLLTHQLLLRGAQALGGRKVGLVFKGCNLMSHTGNYSSFFMGRI